MDGIFGVNNKAYKELERRIPGMRLTIILVISLLVSFVSGCGVGLYEYTDVGVVDHVNNKRVIEVWRTSNFSKSEEEAMKGAIEEWNEVLNGQIEIKAVGEISSIDVDEWEEKYDEIRETRDGWLWIKLNSDHPVVRRRAGSGVLAFVPGLGSQLMMIIGDRIGTKNLKTIMMHEMGHMMGASHVNIDYVLMTPMYGFKQSDCIDLLTVRQVAWFYDLDVTGLNYCVVPE